MKNERKSQISNDSGMIIKSDVISWTTLKYKLDSGPQEKDLESDQKCPIVTF
ncbi:hypothetical protein SAMN05660841_00890 [Sphingobacterium nematocida]|uniref:Uncharacterized protein n=1 Tax=Sphingobacterium nematocida TaxID=1513896 RepID=A0A1T5BR36_9SPHI|nr:hypothetical protein SAMN05660841_00890 [Sphingobacterium nematocida]